jgi:hypothetical protein
MSSPIYPGSVLEGTDLQRQLLNAVSGPFYLTVLPLVGDHTVVAPDHNVWYDGDTDTAADDITVTVPAGLPTGFLVHFSKKGTGGDVVFAAGAGMTVRGGLTLSTENAPASVLIVSATEALIIGSVV